MTRSWADAVTPSFLPSGTSPILAFWHPPTSSQKGFMRLARMSAMPRQSPNFGSSMCCHRHSARSRGNTRACASSATAAMTRKRSTASATWQASQIFRAGEPSSAYSRSGSASTDGQASISTARPAEACTGAGSRVAIPAAAISIRFRSPNAATPSPRRSSLVSVKTTSTVMWFSTNAAAY
jgi:hypothetical protein